jgi:hypothetical protein
MRRCPAWLGWPRRCTATVPRPASSSATLVRWRREPATGAWPRPGCSRRRRCAMPGPPPTTTWPVSAGHSSTRPGGPWTLASTRSSCTSGTGTWSARFSVPDSIDAPTAWGGTIENRAWLARQVALDVRETVGDQVAVIAKFNMADGVRGGLWLDQSLVVAAFGAETGSTDTTGSDSTASATVAAIAPGHGGRRHHRPGWHRASDDDLEVDTRARTPRGCRVGECESRHRPWHCTEAGPDGGAPCRPA